MSSQPRRGGGQRGGGGNNSSGRFSNSNSRSSRGPPSGGNRRAPAPGSNSRRPRQPRNVSSDEAAANATEMRDEEVLIAFMPYLKGDNMEAAKIHEDYQSVNDQKAFLKAARDFLFREHEKQQRSNSRTTTTAIAPAAPSPAPAQSSAMQPPSIERSIRLDPATLFMTQQSSSGATSDPQSSKVTRDDIMFSQRIHTPQHGDDCIPRSDSGLDNMKSIENGLDALLQDDPIVILPPVGAPPPHPSIWAASNNHPPPSSMSFTQVPITPPRPIHSSQSQQPYSSSQSQQPSNLGWNSTSPVVGPTHGFSTPGGHNNLSSNATTPGFAIAPQQHHHPQYHGTMSPPPPPPTSLQAPQSPWNLDSGSPVQRPQSAGINLPTLSLPKQQFVPAQPAQAPTTPPHRSVALSATPKSDPLLESPSIKLEMLNHVKPEDLNGTMSNKTPKELPPPKRLWTHFEEQPGRILVNGCDGSDSSLVLDFAPRQELTANWSLPLGYLNQKRQGCTSLEAALDGLTVGLFRRGCTENGAQASIISKKVTGDENRSYDYGLDPANNAVRGKVPFYSPRTPGHVIFRLYWDQEPVHTLAMGPTLHVRVLESEFDSSIRFILSNFKGKKSNPTSLSSLNSLAQVLETQVTIPNESAARAVFGCIQESRKVVEACAAEYSKTLSKLAQLEDAVEELKKQVEEEDARSHDVSAILDDEVEEEEHGLSEMASSLREKTRALMSGRASCERKWRDSQLAFASILKAAVSNQSMNILLRRDMITKLRLEFELWCPLCEEFAVPVETAKMWYEPLRDTSQSITAEFFQQYAQARGQMQVRILGFEPNTVALDDILFPRNRGAPNQRSMDPRAVNVFNVMSTAMGQCYQELFADEERIVHRRELIRQRTEQCVQECGAFPPGTRVVIFGSSANGFGSPKSDIDMCLQLPHGPNVNEEDRSGATAMSKLAEHLEKNGMNKVDTCRLSARIPVIKFYCPCPLPVSDEEEDIECDLSMHNPLAVQNTALLRTYAEITPVTRVLAAIVKRWAKARDINNPARHTLSSYGYIIMLLHFVTFHKRTGNGLVTPVAPPEGDPRLRRQPGQPSAPLLPNLQWMDPMWPNFPRGTPYRDLPARPSNIMKHPLEEGKTVNSYFYQPSTPNDKAVLQMLFPGQDLSLAILLASFFRYYAYEFDYKRFVVSLHSTATRGLVEREVKAELDGWRNYSAALTIEDPFETFYDVAHVLRGGYYHRIRREFAVAYTKIADAATGRTVNWKKDLRSMTGQELIDWICEPVANEREQQQQPSPPVP